MKKKIGALLAILLVLILSGCSESYEAEESTIFIGKDGVITETSVEKMDWNHYSETDVEGYIESEIEGFDGSSGTVEQVAFEVEGDQAKLTLSYTNWETYSEFNRRTFYTGTVVKAQAAGFEYEGSFQNALEEGPAEREEVIDIPDRKVVILENIADVKVKVPGKILYFSGNCELLEKNIASVKKGESDSLTELAYIIYK